MKKKIKKTSIIQVKKKIKGTSIILWIFLGGLLALGVLVYFLPLPIDIVIVPPERVAVIVPIIDLIPDIPEVVFIGISRVSPLDISTDQELTNNIIVTFDEAMIPVSINEDTFTIRGPNNLNLGGVITSDSTGRIWAFNPTNNLGSDTIYDLTITTEAQGVSGNNLIEDFKWSFTTRKVRSSGGSSTASTTEPEIPQLPEEIPIIPSLTVCSSGCNVTTLQDAINLSSSGDTILLTSGNYTEVGQIVINKNLTVIGEDKATTIIKPAQDTGTGGDARGWFLVNDGVEFNLSDITLDGDGHKIWQAIRHKGPGTIDNVHFTDIRYFSNGINGSPYNGNAIAAFGSGNIDVTNSEFDNIGRIGVLYFGAGITNSTFDNNIYTGKGVGNWLDYALDISNGAKVTVSNNVISNNLGVASSDGSPSAGIVVTTFFGPGTTATITSNTISNNTQGIAVGYDGADSSLVVAHLNKFVGNNFGIISTNPVVNASVNWWGDATGPFHATDNPLGLGDNISDNVTFSNFCTTPNCS